ncbi:MAG: hypothetical protein U1E63_15435 [Burkholderiales bacterium]
MATLKPRRYEYRLDGDAEARRYEYRLDGDAEAQALRVPARRRSAPPLRVAATRTARDG